MSDDAAVHAQPYPLGETIVRLRWVILIVSVLLAAVAASGMRFHVDEATGKLIVETDSRVYFAKDNPDRMALEALEETYTKDNSVLIVMAPKNGNVFTRETLSLVEELTEQGWQTPFSRRVDSLTNFQYSRAEGEDLVISDLVTDAASLTDEQLVAVRDIAMTRKALYKKVVSEKGDVTAVVITVLNPAESLDEIPQVVTYVRDMVDKARAGHPEIDFYLAGGVMIDMAFAEASEADSKTLVLTMLALIIVIIAVSMRTILGTLVTFLVIILSVFSTLGLAGWYGLVLNSSTSAAPVIVMTLSVAHCVHILAAMQQQRAHGLDKQAALVEALRVNMQPIAITSITTAIGFLSLNFSESPPLRELGNLVAIGVILAWLYSVISAPAVLALLPVGARTAADTSRFMDGLADFVISRRVPLMIATGFVLVAAGFGITRIILDDDFIRYFDHRYQFRVDADFTQDRLTGIHAIEFSVPAGEEQGITRPEYLEKLDKFAEWYRQQDKVAHVSVMSDTIKRLNQNVNGDDPAFYAIPESSELAAQYLMLYELSVPYGLDLNSSMDVGKSASRVTVTPVNTTSAELLDIAAKGEAWLQENAPDMWAKATGMSMAVSRISERNNWSMLRGTLLALVLISAVLGFVLRDALIAGVSLAPNLMPAAIAFGIWGYLFQEVNLAISVVIAMTLGIVVDDTVHLLSKYLRGRREYGMDSADAVRYSFSSVGIALTVTTVALVAGFGVLASSGFAVNGDMGLLSAITISVALIADFLFLPPLLILLDRRKMS